MEAWIREKELLVSQGDLGKDYEHCMELQRKLNDAGSGATRGVDKERIDQIFQARQMKNEITKFVLNSLSIQMAAKLCSEAGSEAPAVESKRKEIGGKYAALQQDIQVASMDPPFFEIGFNSLQTGVQSKTCRGRSNARVPKRHRRHPGQDQGEDPPPRLH